MNIGPEQDKLKEYLHFLVILFITLIGFVAFDYGSHKAKKFSFVEELAQEVLTPVQVGLNNGQSIIGFYLDRYLNIVDNKDKLLALQAKNRNLNIQIHELQYYKEENVRLKALINFSQNIKYKKILARVISLGNSNHYFSIKINKGKKEGISKNSVVINAEGLVGIVTHVTHNYSEISTILDFSNRVDVLSKRSRVHGVMRGDIERSCLLKFVKRDEDIITGDTLQTSGMGAIYPKGINVGIVTQVKSEDYDLTKKIVVNPFVDFSKLEEVMILTESEVQDNKEEKRI